jgi:hypothetical protein
MRLLALIFVLIAFPADADGLGFGPAPGVSTDKLVITLTNTAGDTLALWGRHSDKTGQYHVIAEFRLAGGQKFGLVMPTYRIDGSEELETQWMQDSGDRYGEKWGDVEAARIWWMVWGAPEKVIEKRMTAHSWFTGNTIVINYKSADGSVKAASFPLTAARTALESTMGLKLED